MNTHGSYKRYAKAWSLRQSVSSKIPFTLLDSFMESPDLDVEQRSAYSKFIPSSLANLDEIVSCADSFCTQSIRRNNVESYRSARQIRDLLKKFPFEGEEGNCRRSALDTFREAEERCKETNVRLLRPLPTNYLRRVHFLARRIISDILGNRSITDLLNLGRHGPGMGIGSESFAETTAFFKYSSPLTSTEEAAFFVKGAIATDPHWFYTLQLHPQGEVCDETNRLAYERKVLDQVVHQVGGNRITFVPKDRNTHRTIAIEPTGNLWWQLAIGNHIRQRLKCWGIDLDDQAPNCRMAREGSIDGDLATLDLSMASDTLSLECVRSLLPSDWVALLETFRSPCGSIDGEQIEYQKFSSMGNGYNFELESLVFFALSLAVYRIREDDLDYRSRLRVYGDDIIIPSAIFDDVCHVFEYYGFIPNSSKSFSTGSFRESCGADFFLGVNVRPFYLRREITSVYDIFFVANSFAQKSMSLQSYLWHNAYGVILSYLPDRFLMPGPLHFEVDPLSYNNSLKQDDLEACLRIPLGIVSTSFKNKIRVDKHSQGISYQRFVILPNYFDRRYRHHRYTEAGRYHIFLQGVRGGHISLRGNVKRDKRSRVTSRWDGTLSLQQLYIHPGYSLFKES